MTINQKLDYIIERLNQLAGVIDPMPGYVRGNDGLWRNGATGETIEEERERDERFRQGVEHMRKSKQFKANQGKP